MYRLLGTLLRPLGPDICREKNESRKTILQDQDYVANKGDEKTIYLRLFDVRYINENHGVTVLLFHVFGDVLRLRVQ